MGNKINIAVLFGGKSVEHEVSLLSARNVIEALDREKYTITLIGIDKGGEWHFYDEADYLINADDPEAIELGEKKSPVEFSKLSSFIDMIFPVLHGSNGEDGTVQGLCALLNIPFVGAGVIGSSVGMDKDVMKRLLRDAKISTPRFSVLHLHQRPRFSLEEIVFPVFVKPSNGGSSLGISKVKTREDLEIAMDVAFQFDRKILIEEAIEGREIQCSLLGNEHPIVSLPCEIIPKGDFHSYSSKYIDPEGAEFIIPAQLNQEELSKVQMTAMDAYKVLCCEGLARMDMFLTPDGTVLVSEINTLPGLTNMSPYSKMWKASGLNYAEMLEQLIELARKAHENTCRNWTRQPSLFT
ncbi:MAG: D-alanine--D-alanine ligase A [Chlamydiae bacterium]|nr:D-alanine--D-alanine ligase A [Chlamydiota bacterium]